MNGPIPAVNTSAPQLRYVKQDKTDATLADHKGHVVLLFMLPSLDTSTCAVETRVFNQRVAGLGVERVPALLGVRPGPGDPVDVPVDPIDGRAVHREPAAAVHPRPPATDRRDLRGRAADRPGERAERGHVERTVVVDAQVGVGLRGVRAAGPAPAQQHPGHPGHLGQPGRQLAQPLVAQSHAIILRSASPLRQVRT